MYSDNEFKAPKLGPVVPASYPKVTFRIKGEHQLREFNGVHHYNAFGKVQSPVFWCQEFINLKCRAFLKLDGYDPKTRTAIKTEIIQQEIDYFYSDHPLIKI